MKYVIYIDVFFCVNLVMDFIIIKLSSLYIKPQTTCTRCFLGALVGSLLTLLSILIPFNNMLLYMLFSYVFIAIIIVVVSFGIMKIGYLIKNSLVIYAITIFMGGLISFIYSYTGFGYIIQSVFSGIFQGVNLLWLVGATTVTYICIEGIVRFVKRNNQRNMRVKVRLCIAGRYKDLQALVDTGNSLLEPYTGKPVHIVCKNSIEEIIENMELYKTNFKYVPFRSIGKKHGLLKTMEFDEMQVYQIENVNGEMEMMIYKEERAIIGLYDGKLSEKSEFEMILHRSVNI